MIGLLGYAVATFVAVDRKDPITDARQVALAAESDGNTLMIGCGQPNTIEVGVVPADYDAPNPNALLSSYIEYRFGNETVKTGFWSFERDQIKISSASEKADFIDKLSQNSQLYVRYQFRGHPMTMSFLYEVSREQIATVMKACAPKKVVKILTDMHSPALNLP